MDKKEQTPKARWIPPKEPKFTYEEWMKLVEKITVEHYGLAAKQVALLRSIHSVIERDMEKFKASKNGEIKERKPGNWLYLCGHQRMRPASGEILPDPCKDESLSEEEKAVGRFPVVEEKEHKPKIRSVTLHLMTGEMDGKQPATKPHEVKADTEELSREFRNLLRREFGDGWRGAMASTFKVEIR